MGNTRLNFGRDENGVLFTEDSNDYYPFGLNFINSGGSLQVYNPSATYKNYKYNGKELQETGMYDYGARMYMPDIGRWGVIDPLAEKTMEPYAYVYNNPVNMIDPTGMEGEEIWDHTGGGGESAEIGGFEGIGRMGGNTHMPGDDGSKGDHYYAGSGSNGSLGAASGGKCPPDCPSGITAQRTLPDRTTESDIAGVTVTGRLKSSSSGLASNSSSTGTAVGNMLSQFWDSNFARSIVPDRMGVTLGTSAGGGVEFGISGGLEVILRGNDAGIYMDPFNTASLGGIIGVGGEGNLNFFTSRFTGNVSNLSLNSVVGTEVYVAGTVAVGGGINGGYSISFDPKAPFSGDRWHTTTGGISIGAKGSVGAGVTISNTRVGIGFDG